MNVVVLVGRLVADPELRYTPSGIAVASFRIGVTRPFKSKSGEQEADFIDIVAWQQRGEYAANYLTKGQRVAVQGSMQVRSWVQQDGQKRWRAEVVADRLEGLDKPRGDGQAREAEPPAETEHAPLEPVAEAEASDMDYDPFAEE